MAIVKVWVLLLFMQVGAVGDPPAGGPTVIDNITSESECQNLAASIRTAFPVAETQATRMAMCFPVTKTVAK